MTADNSHHIACVDAWVERVGPAAMGVEAFERALKALWRRALSPLGEITLGAIVDRVLYVAIERYPLLSSLRVEMTGLSFDDLRAAVGEGQHPMFGEACRFVLIELLTVIGNLTAEILTPPLHAELERVGVAPGDDAVDDVQPVPTLGSS